MLTYKVKTGGQVILIPIEDIMPPAFSTRIYMSQDEISQLSVSIKENGVLSPVLVRDMGNGLYQIVSGERRRQAAIMAGIMYLPSLLINCDETEAYIININQNIHRRELHFLERAQLIDRLRNFMSTEEISHRLSIAEGLILSEIRLLQLSDSIISVIIRNNLNEETANALLRIPDEEKQKQITELMINSGVSLKEAIELTKSSEKKPVFAARYKDTTIFENTIEHAVSTMTASGIQVKSEKTENENELVYKISINKMI